ncbi:MAG: RsbRD N-terminal domain-containing protein [Desulfobacterales bacterium]|nr:MAG: RsbRD N-terminal domain-containing protein [Desulfobacterales bacterium]
MLNRCECECTGLSQKKLTILGVLVETELEKLIEREKPTILKKWFDIAIQSYDPDTAKFLSNQKDPFANPVGSSTLKGLQGLLDQLLKDLDRKAVHSYLDPIIRIRAVQAFTPSQATAFILSLKQVLREMLDKKLQDPKMAKAFMSFESKIDRLCLMAFDIYMECKEKIYQISANETRNRTFRTFERAGLLSEKKGDRPKIKKTIN